jgi:hypothetical protein
MQKFNELFVKDKMKKLENQKQSNQSSNNKEKKLDTYKKDMKAFLKM